MGVFLVINTDVKPCPFCGSEKIHASYECSMEGKEVVYSCGCENCGSQTGKFSKIEERLKAWNKRTTP